MHAKRTTRYSFTDSKSFAKRAQCESFEVKTDKDKSLTMIRQRDNDVVSVISVKDVFQIVQKY